MSTSLAHDLASAFYSLRNLEFFQPHRKFSAERELVHNLTTRARALGAADFHRFSQELIQNISSYCRDETSSPGVLQRAFDGMDDVLEINYQETYQMMPAADSSERLYEGGGVGVQTFYSTILKVLEHLQLAENSHLIDLGSGFGRVGLVAGLWRKDLRFSGYEYVGHRVRACNASAERAGVDGRVRFIQQDLSDQSFEIPVADVYYLYDPFSISTYHHVFGRLTQLGRMRPTTVVAKAGARTCFQGWINTDDWLIPETLDEGTILVFRSKPSCHPFST